MKCFFCFPASSGILEERGQACETTVQQCEPQAPLVLTSGVLTQSMAWCCAEGRKAWQLYIVRTRSCRSLKKEATQLKIDTTQPTQPAKTLNKPASILCPFPMAFECTGRVFINTEQLSFEQAWSKPESSRAIILSVVGRTASSLKVSYQEGRQAGRQALGPRSSAEGSKLERVKYLLNVQSSCTVDFPVTHLQFLPSGIM